MKEIELANRRGIVIVDDEDYIELEQSIWYLTRFNDNVYAIRVATEEEVKIGYPSRIRMHRQIMRVIDSTEEVDHIDRDGLNNQKSNLRIATSSQNKINRAKRDGTSSIYRGVYKSGNKWIAQIHFNKKYHYLGMFNSEVEAAIAYNNKALELHGSDAQLNAIK
jgi:hypothetical protein